MLSKIFKVVGTPTEESWPDMATMPACQSFRFADQPERVGETLRGSVLSPGGIALLVKLLDPSPTRRITVAQALEDPWLSRELPEPASEAEIAVIVRATGGVGHPQLQSASPTKVQNAPAGRAIPSFGGLGDSDDDEEDIGFF
jgi:serine/threonine protein kinase